MANNNTGMKAEPIEGLLKLLLDLQIVERNHSTDLASNSDVIDSEASDETLTALQNLLNQTFEEAKSSESSAEPNVNQKVAISPDKKPEIPQQKKALFLSSVESPELSELRQLVATLEKKLTNLEGQIYEPTELINPLIPLMTELLTLKSTESRESLLEAIIPVIDEAIARRSGQDLQKMGSAIAAVLPAAISQKIKDSPREFAKAIAPEISMAIEEQIELDRDSISHSLGPEMGKAIKTQIEVERDAMVDALYPVIGNTISKYMVEVVQSINNQVETALSPGGIKRKIRAKIQGVSEAELILKEAINYEVRAIFLIHKASGLVIREIQPSLEMRLEADMLAGMLTAIRSFVNDCMAQPGKVSELNQIEYDDSKIILEVAGYCYLAVVVKGEPPKSLINQIRRTLSQIVLKHGRAIEAFDGNPTTIPEALQPLLEKLAETKAKEKASKPPIALLLLLTAIILPWGIIQYRSVVASRIEDETSAALDAAPELSVYRITPDVEQGKLILTGKVPNQYLRDKAGQIATQTAPKLQLDNQILAVEVPPDPVLTAGEVKRVNWLLNQREGVAITSHHDYGNHGVRVEGVVQKVTDAEQIAQAFQQIPGIESVINTVQIRPILETVIYFDSNSTQLSSPGIASKINAIRQFLDQNTRVHLKMIGYSDYRGQESQNQELGIGRARAVQQALIAQGVNPARLQVSGSLQLPPGVTAEQPLWLSRCVRFEVFIPPVSSK